MAVKRFVTYGLLSFILLGLFACSSEKKVTREERIIPAERLIVKLEANRRKIKTFVASGNITVNSPEINTKFNFTIEYKKPDSLKIVAFGPFGLDLASLLLTDDYFYYYDAIGNVLYKGENEKKIIERLFRIPISTNSLKSLMIGRADFSSVLRVRPQEYRLNGSEYEMKFVNENGASDFFRIARKDLNLLDFEILSNENGKILSVNYSNFKRVKNYSEYFPFKIYVESPPRKSQFVIEYHSVKINENLNDLRLTLPSDVKIRKLN